MKILNEKYKDFAIFEEDFKNAKPFPHIVLDDFYKQIIYQEMTP